MNDTVLYQVYGGIAIKAIFSCREHLGFVDAREAGRAFLEKHEPVFRV